MGRMSPNIEVLSQVLADGFVELSLEESSIPKPGADEVVVQVHAAPINPFDLRLMIGPADPTTAVAVGTRDRAVTRLRIPDRSAWIPQRALRLGAEGFGRVVDAGSASSARALLNRVVAAWAGGMYSQYCKVRSSECLPLPESTPAAAGAAAHINPLTAQAMVETMRTEGYAAVLNSAAGSNLGGILRRLCLAEGIELMNVVRSNEQAQALRSAGVRHVCVSSAASFVDDLTAWFRAAGPTLGFDAVGGGSLASTLIFAMDAARAHDDPYPPKNGRPSKVYIYGSLDPSPSLISRRYSNSWSIAGWVLPEILKTLSTDRVSELKQRIVRELTTVFAAQYTRTVSLAEMIAPQTILACARRSTGAKHLVDPRL